MLDCYRNWRWTGFRSFANQYTFKYYDDMRQILTENAVYLNAEETKNQKEFTNLGNKL